jgi:Spy/CpxP family protein refolding chaperone
MDIFAQRKLLIRIIIVLTVLNLITISVFIWKSFDKGRPRKGDFHGVAKVLQKELHLSEAQFEQFKQLRNSFFEKEKVLSKTIRDERDSMNMFMFHKNTPDSLVRSLAKAVADHEYQMEISRIEQAKAMKEICSPGQLEKLEQLTREIRDFFKPEQK